MAISQQSGWYSITEGQELQQGDFLDNFPVIIPPYSIQDNIINEEIGEIEVKYFNVIILTQSCDLADFHDADPVILCPRYDYSIEKKRSPNTYGDDGWGKLIRGRIVGKHLLNRCNISGHSFDYQLVDLRQMFSVPFELVQQIATKTSQRVRLVSPYREQLAQMFALQFMRVALIEDLPKKYKDTYD